MTARRMLASLRLACAAVLLAGSAAFPTVLPDGGPAPSFLKNVEGTLYFATYETDGWRLWKSDGTDAGTVSLVSGLGLDVELVPVDATLVFSSRGKLWKTDGTAAGTTVVSELPFYPNGIKPGKNGVYFTDGRGQLWKSDLTAAGTVLVKDIPPGYVFHDLTPAAITTVLGRIFFRAIDVTHGNELWVSNGTEDGTTVLDLNPFAGSGPGSMAYFDGTLLFAADDGTHGDELWRSDGTPEGTHEVKDINPTGDSFPLNLRAIGDVAFFSADDGSGAELWKTDGTTDGTVRVADINPNGASYPNALLNVAGTLYFRADDGTHGTELWKSDGTPEGTVLVADVNPIGSSVPAALHQIKGRVFFTADDGVHGEELWTSDGTGIGTTMVADLNPTGSAQPHYMVVAGERLFFAADDGEHGTELWTLDCATGGWPCTPRRIALPAPPPAPHGVPFLVKDLNPGPGDGNPYYLASVGNRLFFQAFRPDTGNELWTSDGTEGGTTLVRDLQPGPGDSFPHGFVDLNGTAFFLAESTAYGSGLWKSDGTEAGTELVYSADSGYGWFAPTELTVFENRLYYFVRGTTFDALWRTDGTIAGTERVVEVTGSIEIAAAADALYFLADHPSTLKPGLWKSDGTAGGTSPIAQFTGKGVTGQLVAAGTRVFLRSAGILWRSDGSPDGNVVLPGFEPKDITAVGDDVFFSAETFLDGTWLGRELWKSDGTPDGTHIVADINPGPGDSLPGRLTNVNGTLFFWATDGKTGFELWKSDGTAHGTLLVRDVDPTDVTVPSYFQAVGNLLYFTAHNPSFGYELWRSDGTTEGTMIVRNINLVRSSYPESPANVGGTLFFYADDGRFGDELWAVTPCGDGTRNAGEECDDANRTSGDGCSALCRLELIERCDNCQDDDGDGLVDLQDPQCCVSTGTLDVDQLRVGRRGGRRALRLAGSLVGIDLGTPTPIAHDVALQLHAGDIPPYCARIPAESLRAGRKGLRFEDPKASVATANGLTGLTIRRRKNGVLRLRATGRSIPHDVASNEASVLVGFGPGAASGCAGGTIQAGHGPGR